MILYSPASYFFVHNCGTNHQRTNFFMGYLCIYAKKIKIPFAFFKMTL